MFARPASVPKLPGQDVRPTCLRTEIAGPGCSPDLLPYRNCRANMFGPTTDQMYKKKLQMAFPRFASLFEVVY
jgi:hypothetical protein